MESCVKMVVSVLRGVCKRGGSGGGIVNLFIKCILWCLCENVMLSR